VRGTQFEVLVRADQTNQIKVFDGTVKVTGTTTATLTAGQQIDADANGRLSVKGRSSRILKTLMPWKRSVRGLYPPAPTQAPCKTTTGEGLATGQTAQVDYSSPAGRSASRCAIREVSLTLTVIDRQVFRIRHGRARVLFRATSVGRRVGTEPSCER